LGDEVHGLLRRTALAIDGSSGYVGRKPRGDPRVASYVAALFAGLGYAPPHHIID
jgi:hypothetical protein